jgi:outer membrane scaffolding protein for murein synthesis (MipA/OmpV family)/alpha-beta hydrolase superfamily lysophospholipase
MKNLFCIFICFFVNAQCISAEELTFKSAGNQLVGHYLSPLDDKPSKGVIIFVHGDGAMSYDADGYYSIVWEQLREHGYSVFSWDKPGIGSSSGNWLKQSMEDRQNEVLSAVKLIQKKYGFTANNTGLLGFSQAGWVIPSLASKSNKIGFVIGVGFAQNWISQGRYHTRVKHETLKKSPQLIQHEIKKFDDEIDVLKSSPSYASLPPNELEEDGLSKDRFEFILKNFESDATQDYKKINIPALFLWGKNDMNVDAKNEYAKWKDEPRKNITVKLLNNATHGLLNNENFSGQQFGIMKWFKLMWLQQDALAPEFMPTLLNWLDRKSAINANATAIISDINPNDSVDSESSNLSIGLALASSSSPYIRGNLKPSVIPVINMYWEGLYIKHDRAGAFIAWGDNWTLGLAAGLDRAGGKNRDNSKQLTNMRPLDTVFVGALDLFIETSSGDISVDIAHDFSNKHSGYSAEASYSYLIPLNAWSVSPKISLLWLSETASNYYYGVSKEEAQLGRAEYQPGASYKFGLGGTVDYSFDKNNTIFFDATIKKASNAIRKSPIIDKDYTFHTTLGYLYSF